MMTNRKEMNISSPLKAIRAMCLECVGYVTEEVKACTAPDCPLYPFRLGRSVRGKSRLKAIRKHCLECMGGSSKTVAECSSGPRHGENGPGCSVFELRFGKNPKLKGKGKGRDMAKVREAAQKGLPQARATVFRAPESTISTRGIPNPRENQTRAGDSV